MSGAQEPVTAYMVDPQRQILEELAYPKMTRASVALTYAFALRAADAGEVLNWPLINQRIISRWSQSALIWIKREAWKRVQS